MGDAGTMRVLVVEDDESTAEAIAFHIRTAGLQAEVASDGLAALRALGSAPPDALILDLMLPHVDGWHIIRRVREWAPRLPIIVVTARTNEHDRVEVLALGADDVMAKPFSMRELLARVTAALRRSAVEKADGAAQPISEGELTIDPERMSVVVAGRPAALTPLELKLLRTLAESRARALSRDEIYRRVWGERAHGDRSVDVLARRLRRKVDEVDGPSPTSRPTTASATASGPCRGACRTPARASGRRGPGAGPRPVRPSRAGPGPRGGSRAFAGCCSRSGGCARA